MTRPVPPPNVTDIVSVNKNYTIFTIIMIIVSGIIFFNKDIFPEEILCKYKVGDNIITITGDKMVVIKAEPGKKGSNYYYQPIYRLSNGVGIKIDVTFSGLQITKTSYSLYEDQIKEKTP